MSKKLKGVNDSIQLCHELTLPSGHIREDHSIVSHLQIHRIRILSLNTIVATGFQFIKPRRKTLAFKG